VVFVGRTLRSSWAFRAGEVYAWAAALGYATLAAIWSTRGDSVSPSALVYRALVWISWAGGVSAWALARNVEDADARLGLDALAALRGASPRDVFVARIVATAAFVARTVALPGIVLCVTVAILARSPTSAAEIAATVLVYAILFGIVFGCLARFASHVSPRHGRIVFAALVLGPELLRSVFDDVPTLIAAFGGLIDLFLGFGGTAA